MEFIDIAQHILHNVGEAASNASQNGANTQTWPEYIAGSLGLSGTVFDVLKANVAEKVKNNKEHNQQNNPNERMKNLP